MSGFELIRVKPKQETSQMESHSHRLIQPQGLWPAARQIGYKTRNAHFLFDIGVSSFMIESTAVFIGVWSAKRIPQRPRPSG